MDQLSVSKFWTDLDESVRAQRDVVDGGEDGSEEVDVEGLLLVQEEQGGERKTGSVEEYHLVPLLYYKDSNTTLDWGREEGEKGGRKKGGGEVVKDEGSGEFQEGI